MGDPLGHLRHTPDCANKTHSSSNCVAGSPCCFDCNSRDTQEHACLAWLVPKGRAGGSGCFLSFVLIYPNALDRAAGSEGVQRVSLRICKGCLATGCPGRETRPSPVCVTSKLASAFANGTVDIAALGESFAPDVLI